MSIWLILALVFAGLETVAVWKAWRRVEFFAKPAVMMVLIIWLYVDTGLQGNVVWFGMGLLFSLIGDVLLLFPNERMFLPGLVAFWLTHVFYLLGLKDQLLNFSAWSLLLLFFILWNGIRLLRRIVSVMRARGQNQMVNQVILYGLTVSLMLYAAMSTIFDPAWATGAALFVSLGAFLFWISDLMLAWNKFVVLTKSGRVPIILTYELGQILLIAGVISHFTT